MKGGYERPGRGFPTSTPVHELTISSLPSANAQLLGFSAATGLGIYYLQQDTKEAQGLLTSSVEELTRDTQRITTHLDRLQTTEKDLVALRKDAATKDDLIKLRAELKKACVSTDIWETVGTVTQLWLQLSLEVLWCF